MVSHLHVGFKVQDYAQWKAGYDASIEQRKTAGETSFRVFRGVDDPNMVAVLSEQEDVAKIRAFMTSPLLAAEMKAAGITEMGQMFLMEEVDSGVHSRNS